MDIFSNAGLKSFSRLINCFFTGSSIWSNKMVDLIFSEYSTTNFSQLAFQAGKSKKAAGSFPLSWENDTDSLFMLDLLLLAAGAGLGAGVIVSGPPFLG